MPFCNGCRQTGLVPGVALVFRLPVTAAKFITKSSLFILLPSVIRQPGLKLNSEQKPSIYSSRRHIAKPNVSGKYVGGYNKVVYLSCKRYQNSMVLLPQIRFKQRSWRGRRVKVPRPVKARFDDVCSDLSSFIHLNPFKNANVKWSKC